VVLWGFGGNKGTGTGTGTGKSKGKGKGKGKSKMRGFFAALRMTNKNFQNDKQKRSE
jgi:hypothetical protein